MQGNKLTNGYQQKVMSKNPLIKVNNHHLSQTQQMYQLKQMEKLNEYNDVDKNKIKELVIQPKKLDTMSKPDLDKRWKDQEKTYKTTLEQYWEKKTNTPYKGILKQENYNFKIEKGNDLVVHRVTVKDKNKEEVETRYDKITNEIKKHDGELKVIYATSKENEHKKKFDYVHVYKYRVQHTGGDDEKKGHDSIKQDRLKYYKDQQKKEEAGKQKMDTILDKLVGEGIFNESDFEELGTKK